MFDISFGEILVVIIVAIVFIGPKDMPVVIRAIVRGMVQIKRFCHEVKEMFDQIAKESGISDIKDELDDDIHYIRGNDGKLYPAYDMDDFIDKNNLPSTSRHPERSEGAQGTTPASSDDKVTR